MEITAFRILGQVPAKKNSKQVVCMGKFPRVLPSKTFKVWHEHALAQVKEYWGKQPPLEREVHVHIDFTNKDRRARDLTNMVESIHDLLVDAGVLPDDNCFVISSQSSGFLGVDKVNAGAIITIRYEE